MSDGMITQTYSLDLVPGGNQLVVNVSQYDKLGRLLVFNLYQAGLAYSIPSGTGATIKGTKPDGKGFDYAMTVGNGRVSITVPQQMTAVAGDTVCEVMLTDTSGNTIATANFILSVECAAMNDATVVSDSDIPVFEGLVAQATTQAANASASATAAAASASSVTAAVTDYFDPIASFNAVFRGKNLGSTITDDQYADIKNGTFKLVRLGDYWAINGQNYRVVAIDWFLHAGDNTDLGHHVVVVPDGCLLSPDGSTTRYMQDTDTTDGGYVGSKMYKTTLPGVLNTLQGIFGSKILKHRELLCNAVSNGASSGWSWYDSYVECMDEVMVYGSTVWSAGGYNTGIGYGQLPLFALRHEFINHRQPAYWLRDVASASWFAYVSDNGDADCSGASAPWNGVRPYFLIG